MAKIIVSGAKGQLGQCIQRAVEKRALSGFVFIDIDELDILDSGKVLAFFAQEKPDYFINCAAYTEVDQAEEDVALYRAVNKNGALHLAQACAKHDATLLHISTDFVFEGNTNLPLKEGDVANPIGVYGLTKLEGEKAIQETLEKHYILRTSWLYSEYANNFVKTMLRLGKEKDRLTVVADQVGTPTYAGDLAQVLLDIIEKDPRAYGTYHFSNEGTASWYDFSKAIFDLANIHIEVAPVPTAAFPTKAQRPVYSVLDKTKIKETFGLQIPYWRESLEVCLKRLLALSRKTQ